MDDNWDSKLLRDTYLEIDLDRLAMNVDAIRRHIGEHVDLCAVIKANGYGMGAVDIAPTLIDNGATFLAVANVPRLVSKMKYFQALVFSSLTMAFLLMLVAFQLYPTLLISSIDPAHSITIYNAASSQKSLGIMLTIVLIGAPLLAAYFLFLYKTFNGKVALDDTSY